MALSFLGANIAMCEALGLDPNIVRSINLHIGHDSLMTATVEVYIEDPALEMLTFAFKHYDLVEREPDSNRIDVTFTDALPTTIGTQGEVE